MKQKIFSGALNRDVTSKFLGKDDYVGASNIIFQASKDGNAGLLRRYPGFLQGVATAGTVLPTSPIVVGSFENRANRLVYFFVNGSDFDGIYKYNPTTNQYTTIISWTGLNFSESNKITGVGMIGDYLFWTDNLNQPRMINVTRYYINISEEDITLIKPAPMYPLVNEFVTDVLATYSPLTDKAYQFSYRYLYPDNQVSVIAPYTTDILCGEDDPLIVGIKLNRNSFISVPNSVVEIEILVRRSYDNNWQIFKTITREQFLSDLLADQIVFSDDLLGISVSISETIKYFESVPVKSKALEVARDRVFLGNNTEGYDLYKIPTLTAELVTDEIVPEVKSLPVYINNTTSNKQIYTAMPGDPGWITELGYAIIFTTTTKYYLNDGTRYYFFKTGPVVVNNSQTSAGDYTGLETTFSVDYEDYITYQDLYYTTTIGVQGQPPSYELITSTVGVKSPAHNVSTTINITAAFGSTKFKNNSQYKIGIVFYDKYLRNAGVYTNENCLVTVNDDFRNNEISSLKWTVNVTDNQYIPSWAHSYQIVRTDNLTKNTFYQGKTSDIYWVREFEGQDRYDRELLADAVAIEIDVSGSFKGGLKYNFTPGDMIDIQMSTGAIKTFAITGAVGSRIRIESVSEPQFEGTLSQPYPKRLFYEIYQLKQRTTESIFYEVGSVHKISQPETSQKAFTSVFGYLNGDTFVVSSDHYDYPDSRTPTAGVFSINDLSVTAIPITVEAGNTRNNIDIGWLKGLGRLNAIVEFGQAVKKTSVRYSNRFIQGTKINGTSNFEVNDEKQFSIEVGAINKLQLASKTQQEGTVMLAICEIECVSMYLGETQITDNVNQSLIGSTVQVIGTVNVINSGSGTIHPESVIHHNGRVWWWDFYNSRVLRYDSNGVREISEIGMKSYFYGKQNPTTGYDPFHNLFFIGFGSDMLSFDENSNQWRSFYTFAPEYCGKVEDFMVSFKNGVPYRSNNSNYAYYFGQQNTALYEFYVSYPTPQILDNISLACTEIFIWSAGKQVITDRLEILVTNESGQETSLLYTDFDVIESTLYAHFLRDKNSLGGLVQGEVMRGDVHKIKLTIKEDIGFETITINDTESSGH